MTAATSVDEVCLPSGPGGACRCTSCTRVTLAAPFDWVPCSPHGAATIAALQPAVSPGLQSLAAHMRVTSQRLISS